MGYRNRFLIVIFHSSKLNPSGEIDILILEPVSIESKFFEISLCHLPKVSTMSFLGAFEPKLGRVRSATDIEYRLSILFGCGIRANASTELESTTFGRLSI